MRYHQPSRVITSLQSYPQFSIAQLGIQSYQQPPNLSSATNYILSHPKQPPTNVITIYPELSQVIQSYQSRAISISHTELSPTKQHYQHLFRTVTRHPLLSLAIQRYHKQYRAITSHLKISQDSQSNYQPSLANQSHHKLSHAIQLYHQLSRAMISHSTLVLAFQSYHHQVKAITCPPELSPTIQSYQ